MQRQIEWPRRREVDRRGGSNDICRAARVNRDARCVFGARTAETDGVVVARAGRRELDHDRISGSVQTPWRPSRRRSKRLACASEERRAGSIDRYRTHRRVDIRGIQDVSARRIELGDESRSVGQRRIDERQSVGKGADEVRIAVVVGRDRRRVVGAKIR